MGHPVRFIAAFNLVIMFLSMFTSIIGMMIGFTFITAIADAVGYEQDSNFRRYMSTTTFVSCMCASSVSPFSSGALLTTGVISPTLAEAGFTINTGSYIITCFLAAALTIIVISFLAKPVFRVDLEPLKNIDANILNDNNSASGSRMNKRQIITGIILISAFLFPVIQMMLPAGSTLASWLNSIDLSVFLILMMAIMEVVYVDGKPLCKTSEAFSKGVSWDVYVCIVAITLLSSGLSNDACGISSWITEIFGSVFSNMSFPMLLLTVVLLCGVVTQIFSNGVTMIIASTLLAPFLVEHAMNGIDIAVFPALISQVCGMGCLTATGSGFVALLLAEPGMREKPNWIFFGGAAMLIVYFIIAIPVGILMGYIL